MKTVKVKEIGVQVNGTSYFKNDVFEVTDEEYEPIKEFVDVLSENSKNVNKRIVQIKVENEDLDLKEVEEYLYNCLENFGKEENTDKEENDGSDTNVGGNKGENSDEDEELEALKERAKELGIKVTHNMKKETLIAKIQETEEIGAGEGQNPEGE
jgi:hypothetical protein